MPIIFRSYFEDADLDNILTNNNAHKVYDTLIDTFSTSYDNLPNQDNKVVIHKSHGQQSHFFIIVFIVGFGK